MVEGLDDARASVRPDDIGTVRVVAAHHLLVIEKVEGGRRQRTFEHFEAIGLERAALGPRETARVVN